MKKADFYIMGFKVSGYTEVFEAPGHSSVELGFTKLHSDKWVIVQMMNGTVIKKHFATRKAAVAAVTSDMLLYLADAMNRENYIKSVAARRERIARAEAKASAEVDDRAGEAV